MSQQEQAGVRYGGLREIAGVRKKARPPGKAAQPPFNTTRTDTPFRSVQPKQCVTRLPRLRVFTSRIFCLCGFVGGHIVSSLLPGLP